MAHLDRRRWDKVEVLLILRKVCHIQGNAGSGLRSCRCVAQSLWHTSRRRHAKTHLELIRTRSVITVFRDSTTAYIPSRRLMIAMVT
jgi:hypothetical protein